MEPGSRTGRDQGEEMFFQLIRQTADPSLLICQGIIRYCNDAMAILVGKPANELISSTFADLAPDNMPEGTPAGEAVPVHLSAATETGNHRFGWVLRDADGGTIPVEVVLTRITQGGETMLHATIRDLSRGKNNENIVTFKHDPGIALGSVTSLHEALDLILSLALTIEGVDCVGVYLLDRKTGAFTLEAHEGLSEEFINQNSMYATDYSLTQQIRSGTPIYDVTPDPEQVTDNNRHDGGLRSTAYIPIKSGKKPIGILNVGSQTTPSFIPATRAAAEILAACAGEIITRIWDTSDLAESRINLQSFFDTIGEFIFILNEEGYIIATNQVLQDRLGYRSEDLTGRHIRYVHSPVDHDQVDTIIATMQGNMTTICTIPLLTKRGEIIPVETRVSRGIWSEHTAIFGISRDITGEQQIQRELAEALDLNEKVVSSSLLGIVAYRAKTGRCIMVNQTASRVLGGTVQELLQQTYMDSTIWKDSGILQIIEEALSSGDERREEIRVVTPTKREIWIDCILIPFIRNARQHILLIFNEISSRKEYEVEIRKQEATLGSIARSARRFLTDLSFDNAINAVLKDLGEEMKVDRVYIFENHPDPMTGTLLANKQYEWLSDRAVSLINSTKLQNIAYTNLEQWRDALSRGESLCGPVLKFESPIRELLSEMDICSVLIIPIRINNELWGFIGFDDCRNEHKWTDADRTALGIASDIIGGAIGRERAVHGLLDTKQQLDDIINYLPDATMVINREGKVIAWNRAMEEMTGVRAEEMLGAGDYQYAVPFYGERKPILIDYALNPYQTITPDMAQTILIDSTLSGEAMISLAGQPRHISTRATLLRDHNGYVIGAIESVRDTTWQIETEQKIREYARDLEDKNHALDSLSTSLMHLNQELDQRVRERTAEVMRLLQIKSDLITQIGHDLRTPLTPIMALLPEAVNRITEPDLHEYLTVIHRNAERLKRVVTMVLAYSRLEGVPDTIDPEGVNARTLFDQAILDSSEDIRKKSLVVENLVPEGTRLYMADTHAETVAMNLISNAIKYTGTGGSVAVEVLTNAGATCLCVRDTGIGLTPEECKRVFDEFYRADNSRHDGESCGLGLAIVSRIVTLYGGRITVESEGKGKGARFCMIMK